MSTQIEPNMLYRTKCYIEPNIYEKSENILFKNDTCIIGYASFKKQLDHSLKLYTKMSCRQIKFLNIKQ